MKIKTIELTGVALDWAVATCEGATDLWFDTVATYWVKLNGEDRALRYGWAGMSYLPSTDWAQGGPIIEREEIELVPKGMHWDAYADEDFHVPHSGTKPLIAAMRCYVASKLGDEVDIPEGLMK